MRAQDIFNCTTTTPSDGHQYLSVVFVECYVPGGLQMALFPWAVMAVALYSCAFVFGCFFVLWKNIAIVMVRACGGWMGPVAQAPRVVAAAAG